MAITITLTWAEVAHAAMVGAMRRVKSVERNYRGAYGADQGDPWSADILGALGECAAAKYFGVYWPQWDTSGCPDLSNGRQVRTTERPTGRLILHPSDPDDALFVLVVGRAPCFTLVGTIRGREGKRPAYWQDLGNGRPAFFVPQSALSPFRCTIDENRDDRRVNIRSALSKNG